MVTNKMSRTTGKPGGANALQVAKSTSSTKAMRVFIMSANVDEIFADIVKEICAY